MSPNLFHGGVPTEHDVKKLLTAFSNLQEGTTILHSDIENILSLTRDSTRYRTIVNAWRHRILNEQNLDLEAVRGVGFRVLPPWDRVSVSSRDFRRSVKGVAKAVRRASRTPVERLQPVEQQKAEHAMKKMDAVLREGRRAAKEIAVVFGPVEPSPRIGPSTASSSTKESNPSSTEEKEI